MDGLERAVAAKRGGASRIELCGSLDFGGVTLEVESMREAVNDAIDLADMRRSRLRPYNNMQLLR